MSDELFQLTLPESVRLAELEQVVTAGLRTFVEVGAALLEIRDARLYRQTHDTFEVYCRERWAMTDRHARRLVQAAQVLELTGPTGPANEAQARELAPLLDEPEALRDVWAEASANGAPTAATVRDAVERRTLDAIAGEPGVLEREADARARAHAAVDAAALIRAAATLRPQHVAELIAAARLSTATSTSTLAEQARAGAERLEQLADLLEQSSRPRPVPDARRARTS